MWSYYNKHIHMTMVSLHNTLILHVLHNYQLLVTFGSEHITTYHIFNKFLYSRDQQYKNKRNSGAVASSRRNTRDLLSYNNKQHNNIATCITPNTQYNSSHLKQLTPFNKVDRHFYTRPILVSNSH